MPSDQSSRPLYQDLTTVALILGGGSLFALNMEPALSGNASTVDLMWLGIGGLAAMLGALRYQYMGVRD